MALRLWVPLHGPPRPSQLPGPERPSSTAIFPRPSVNPPTLNFHQCFHGRMLPVRAIVDLTPADGQFGENGCRIDPFLISLLSRGEKSVLRLPTLAIAVADRGHTDTIRSTRWAHTANQRVRKPRANLYLGSERDSSSTEHFADPSSSASNHVYKSKRR